MEENVVLEVFRRGKDWVFNLVFLDTGEIKQKTRSEQWLADRIFFHEIRTREIRLRVEEAPSDWPKRSGV